MESLNRTVLSVDLGRPAGDSVVPQCWSRGSTRIYVASSWRNERFPAVVQALRDAGYDVFNFRDGKAPPAERDGATSNTQVLDLETMKATWSTAGERHSFGADWQALGTADVTVLVLDCGKSAHLELGYAIGNGQLTVILMEEASQYELMYQMADFVVGTVEGVIEAIRGFEKDLGVDDE